MLTVCYHSFGQTRAMSWMYLDPFGIVQLPWPGINTFFVILSYHLMLATLRLHMCVHGYIHMYTYTYTHEVSNQYMQLYLHGITTCAPHTAVFSVHWFPSVLFQSLDLPALLQRSSSPQGPAQVSCRKSSPRQYPAHCDTSPAAFHHSGTRCAEGHRSPPWDLEQQRGNWQLPQGLKMLNIVISTVCNSSNWAKRWWVQRQWVNHVIKEVRNHKPQKGFPFPRPTSRIFAQILWHRHILD